MNNTHGMCFKVAAICAVVLIGTISLVPPASAQDSVPPPPAEQPINLVPPPPPPPAVQPEGSPPPPPAAQPASPPPPVVQLVGPPPPPEVIEEDYVEDDYKFAMVFNPLSLVVGLAIGIFALELDFQIPLNDYLAFDVIPAFAYYFGDWVEADIKGGGGSLGLRIAPMGSGLRKLYIVPRVMLLHVAGESETMSLSVTQLTPSIEVGYAWIWGHFVLNTGGGIGYNIIVSGDDIYEHSRFGNVALMLNVSIGFAI